MTDSATFQERVRPWMMACFGAKIAADKVERSDRFMRARVFVVASAAALCPAAVLLERCSVRGNPAPRREAREGAAVTIEGGAQFDVEGFSKALRTSSGGVDREDNHTLVPVVFKASHYTREKDGAPSDLAPPLSADADRGDQDTLVLAFGGNMRGRDGENMPEQHEDGETASALRAESGGSTRDLVAFADVADPLVCKEGETYTQEGSGNFRVRNVVTDLIQWAVRRLTPTECERLQGAPDGYTLVKVRRVARKNNELIAQIADAGGAVIVAGKPGHERPISGSMAKRGR
jgi:DNA (cytosine-5)-methyltransferase 1